MVALFALLVGTLRAEEKRGPTTQRGPVLVEAGVLHVCAEANNLPFSNSKGEGFENRIAELVARDLGVKLAYTYRAQRRGYIRETIKSGECDVVMGVPTGLEMVSVTRPYYQSGYVFVWRKGSGVKVASFDDPFLRTARVGLQVVMEAPTPPGRALQERGIIDNVVGYSVFGDYAEANPAARVMEGVEKGEVDVACVWGPFAGYFAKKSAVPLEVVPAPEKDSKTGAEMVFDIGMGVRRGNVGLRDELNEIIGRRGAEIAAILDEYGVPRVRAQR